MSNGTNLQPKLLPIPEPKKPTNEALLDIRQSLCNIIYGVLRRKKQKEKKCKKNGQEKAAEDEDEGTGIYLLTNILVKADNHEESCPFCNSFVWRQCQM